MRVMRVSYTQASSPSGRAQLGSQIAEFGAAIVLLTTFIVIPLLDLVIVPVRWMMAQEIADAYCRKLALCESFGQACENFKSQPELPSVLKKLSGVSEQSSSMRLRISQVTGSGVHYVEVPGEISPEWLPDGANAPCLYSLELNVKVLISPAILFRSTGQQIVGLSAPFPVTIKASHEWENLGRNPATREYFLNE
jgi:hypothetical protein